MALPCPEALSLMWVGLSLTSSDEEIGFPVVLVNYKPFEGILGLHLKIESGGCASWVSWILVEV